MTRNPYRIIVVKDGEEHIRQFSIGKLPFILLFVFMIASGTSIFLLFTDYYSHQEYQNKLVQLQTDNTQLIKKIEFQEEKINQFVERLDTIISQDKVLRDLIKLPQIHDDIRKVGVGGSTSPEESSLEYLLPDSNHQIDLKAFSRTIDYYNRLANLEYMIYDEILETVKTDVKRYRSYPAVYPINLNEAKISSTYGYRRDPFKRRKQFHPGHDFSADRGTHVLATADGVVKESKYYGTFGNYIEIDHGYGIRTIYGHLSKRIVKKGDKIERGEFIGTVGNTGRSTAPHVHYEVLYKNKNTDPANYYFVDYLN
ncbi:MAG: M23 family metallopeptidase [Candidatus Marinimicrobia bacterium]|nr:M23 family metallopeptidase [Candidatus Neomarinimicrobiota bacterium]